MPQCENIADVRVIMKKKKNTPVTLNPNVPYPSPDVSGGFKETVQ